MALARRVVLAGVLLAGTAWAQDLALAESLFQEGRKQLEAGNIAEACKKFDASLRIDRSSGTMLNLAECHLAEGKSATAWAEFLAAVPLAKQQGNAKRAEVAAKRAEEVQKTLSYLTIKVSVPTPGLKVSRNDMALEEATLSSKVATDPGTYTIKATASGYEPWQVEVKLKPGADEQTVTVPALKPSAAPAPSGSAPPPASASAAPPPPPTTSSSGTELSTQGSSTRTIGFVALGAGAVLTGVGAYFGLKAMSTYKDAENSCPSHTNCDPSVKTTRDKASTQALISTLGVGIGVAGIGVGAILLLTAPSSQKQGKGLWLTPVASASSAGLSLDGAF